MFSCLAFLAAFLAFLAAFLAFLAAFLAALSAAAPSSACPFEGAAPVAASRDSFSFLAAFLAFLAAFFAAFFAALAAAASASGCFTFCRCTGRGTRLVTSPVLPMPASDAVRL